MRPNFSTIKQGLGKSSPTSSLLLPNFCSVLGCVKEGVFSRPFLKWFAIKQVHRPSLGRPCFILFTLFRKLPSVGPLLSFPALATAPALPHPGLALITKEVDPFVVPKFLLYLEVPARGTGAERPLGLTSSALPSTLHTSPQLHPRHSLHGWNCTHPSLQPPPPALQLQRVTHTSSTLLGPGGLPLSPSGSPLSVSSLGPKVQHFYEAKEKLPGQAGPWSPQWSHCSWRLPYE